MIITCKKFVPTRWIIFAILPWAAFTFNGGVIGVAFLFSLKKFIENPAGLTFILSLPSILTILVAPIASLLSDRIWTRTGRRKPFVIVSWVGMSASMLLMPVMPTFWLLLAAYIVYQAASALGAPIEPLKQEIIPPAERGFATGAMTWCSNLATVTFYYIMLGRFDDVTYMSGVPVTGEEVIYWSGALLLSVMLVIIVLGIRETDPKSPLRGQKLSLGNVAGGLFDRELLPVYLLVFGSSFLNFYSGLGPLSNLLYTDQWGYTKQEMGVNVAIGGVLNIFVIGLLTMLADRLNRMRAYQTVICLLLGGNAAYYCYVNFVLPDKHPTLVEIIVFGEAISMLSILTGLLYIPLVYDYVRRNKMGTYGAGSSIVNRVATVITLNGVGLFVWAYAVLFQPPAGEMTRIVLKHPSGRPELLAALTPGAGSQDLSANVWQATGVTASSGKTWEIRLRDKVSEALAAEKARLQSSLPPQTGKVDAIDRELKDKAGAFRDRVAGALAGRLLDAGDQVLSASLRPAVLVTLATTRRADDRLAAKMWDDLRRRLPSAIDLHPVAQGGGFALAASAFRQDGADDAATLGALESAVKRVAQARAPGLLASGGKIIDQGSRDALTLDIQTVEEPVETYVSPVTRVVNSVLAGFNHAVRPTARLTAICRNLRSPAESMQVRVERGPDSRSLSVTAILEDTAARAASLDGPVGRRLKTLMGQSAGGNVLLQARAFYDRIDAAAATQRITLAQPLLTAAYAPMQYDYMSGYLWMFVMAALGIALTIVFGRLETRGLIRKYGVEEAEAAS